MVQIKDVNHSNTAQVTEDGYFLVSQFETWLDTLVKMGAGIFVDPITGNAYEIRRVRMKINCGLSENDQPEVRK